MAKRWPAAERAQGRERAAHRRATAVGRAASLEMAGDAAAPARRLRGHAEKLHVAPRTHLQESRAAARYHPYPAGSLPDRAAGRDRMGAPPHDECDAVCDPGFRKSL